MNILYIDNVGRKTETVDELPDTIGLLIHRIQGTDYDWLENIDLYDDTVFNSRQIQPVLNEWRRMMETIEDAHELSVAKRVEDLLARCNGQIGNYIKFIGE